MKTRIQHHRVRSGVLTLALVTATGFLSACSDGSQDAATAFKAAQETLREDGRGSFTVGLQIDGAEMLRTEGQWESEPARARWTTVISDADATTMHQFAADEQHLYQLPDGEKEGCWLEDELGGSRTSPGPQPGVVGLVLESRATGWETEGSVARVNGPVDFVLQAIGDLGAGVELPEGKSVDLDYSVVLDDGRISSLGTSLGEVLQAVEDGGGTVPEQLQPFLSDQLDIPLLAGFAQLDAQQEVILPKPSEVKNCDD